LDDAETRIALIQTVERLAANAWPAAEATELDGWQLRFTEGVTRRANSVNVNLSVGEAALADKVAAVETFYQERGLPIRYQISPAAQPAGLDENLAGRGYQAVAHTAVQIAELGQILRQTVPLRTYPSFEVEVSESFDDEWFALYAAIEHAADPQVLVRRAIFQRIAQPTAYTTLRIDGAPVAVGLGVLEEQWVGIFCLATLSEFRRRGAGGAILRTLAIWAQLYDAQAAYLQVMLDNQSAQSLYTRTGFTTLYHYHYREKFV
jgi:ribosomal protein S18 acetylase RimI-like enzyme